MDMLREGIGLRAYAQKDPLLEYKREGYDMFQEMMNATEREVISNLFKVQIVSNEEADKLLQEENKNVMVTSYQGGEENGGHQPIVTDKKPGRNDPCPCGSGIKYKKCCGTST